MLDLGHFNLAEKQLTPWNTDVSTVFLTGLQYQYYHQSLPYTKASSESKSRELDTPLNVIFVLSNVYHILKQRNLTP